MLTFDMFAVRLHTFTYSSVFSHVSKHASLAINSSLVYVMFLCPEYTYKNTGSLGVDQ